MSSKAIRGKKWGHPDTINFLEAVLENIDNLRVSKGRQESRIKFFKMDAFNETRDGGRTPEQMNTRLENLLKDYRKVCVYLYMYLKLYVFFKYTFFQVLLYLN